MRRLLAVVIFLLGLGVVLATTSSAAGPPSAQTQVNMLKAQVATLQQQVASLTAEIGPDGWINRRGQLEHRVGILEHTVDGNQFTGGSDGLVGRVKVLESTPASAVPDYGVRVSALERRVSKSESCISTIQYNWRSTVVPYC